METWWPVEQSYWFGVIGGGLGCVLGIGGAVVGAVLVPRAKGRHGVVVGMAVIALVGVASMIAGGLAMADDQPYEIYAPLLRVGSVLYLVTASMLRTVDTAFRAVAAVSDGGLTNAGWGWGFGGGLNAAVRLSRRRVDLAYNAAFVGAWREQQRSRAFRAWTVGLLWGHLGLGAVLVGWGTWHYLVGGHYRDWSLGVSLGATFVGFAGLYWLVDFLALRIDRTHLEPQRLAAEELRRR